MLTWIEISKANLLHNIGELKKISGPAKLMAIVKSNAYGHGMHEVSSVIKNKVDWFGVAGLNEALELRKKTIKHKPILVLSYIDPNIKTVTSAINSGISLPIYSKSHINLYKQASKRTKKKVKVHLKIDTGTTRVGILPNTLAPMLGLIGKNREIELEGVYSHFADSETNHDYSLKQLKIFNASLDTLKKRYPKVLSHIACSAASVLYPKARQNLVRAGLMLYGLHPSKKTLEIPNTNDYVGKKIDLKPVLIWKTRVIMVKEVPRGTFVGYGLTYKTQKNTRIAVLPIGYFDGYDRSFSNRAWVVINGNKIAIAGRICMNLSMLDCKKQLIKEGDEAILLGKQDGSEVTAEDLAKISGTINYEIVTRINSTLPRIII